MPTKVSSLVRASLKDPVKITINSSLHQEISALSQSFLVIPQKHKDIYMVHLLSMFNGRSSIIFTRTVAETDRLTCVLRNLGFRAVCIHGRLSQSQRLGALSGFNTQGESGRNILVATDVASRGLDVPSVSFVFNYDFPLDAATYIHRVGRTARAGQSGRAIILVTQYDFEPLLRLEHVLGRKIVVFSVVKEDAMMYSERVSEAQILAISHLRQTKESQRRRRGVKRGNSTSRGGTARGTAGEDMDLDEG
jgi:ATP-dependent RNA helicase DDX47/RRP3